MYNRKDSYYLKAKKEGYKSRAAYKLKELNAKYRLLKKGDRVLDCGAAPGGWSQVALEIVGNKGLVIALDYAAIEGMDQNNFHFIQGNMLEQETIEKVFTISENVKFDVVLSDMAPKTTGIKIKDHSSSIELATIALNTAVKVLKRNGTFVVKVFDGEDRENYISSIKKYFKNVKLIRPESTRKSSFELYVTAKGYEDILDKP